MSRALNIDADRAHVEATAGKHKAAISAIEPLLPRGTRVVFVNMAGATAVAKSYGRKVMTGKVERVRLRP